MKVAHLETDKGNQILEDLKRSGWKKVREYSPWAFDKGIDFDSYTLQKNGLQLVFEWTNWFEWEISGSREAIEGFAKEYSLSIQDSPAE